MIFSFLKESFSRLYRCGIFKKVSVIGPLAHLVERTHGMGEVSGSSPLWSTKIDFWFDRGNRFTFPSHSVHNSWLMNGIIRIVTCLLIISLNI